jgi:hypothetical protein
MESRLRDLTSAISTLESKQEKLSRDFHEQIELGLRRESQRDETRQSLSQDDMKLSPRRVLPGESGTNGIIGSLRSQHGDNVHDRGIVEVFASPCSNNGIWCGITVAAKNVLDFANDTLYLSENVSGRMIGYDFKTMRVCPTHYSLRSNLDGAGGSNLKSWKIEVSDDMSTGWVEIDQRMSDPALNGQYKTELFTVQYPPKRGYRYIRLTQTGKNWGSNDHLFLAGFEVFGDFTQV